MSSSSSSSSAPEQDSLLQKRPVLEEPVQDDQQPEAKRPKLEDGSEPEPSSEMKDEASEENSGKPKIYHKKRKCMVLMGFQGTKYQGMQINPGSNTIEAVLKKAFHQAGLVANSNADDFKKINFQRCARTDKGVHALGQIVSVKLFQNPDLIQLLNDVLPPEIRVFGSRVVSQAFCAKASCEARTYEYNLPTYSLIPSSKPYQKGVGEFESSTIRDSEATVSEEQFQEMLNFRLPAETLEKARSILNLFCGTHSFHNYTAGGDHKNASMRRYISSFTASDPYVYKGIEYIKLRVKGQSFILHQIRKMVAFMVCLVRDNGPIEAVEASFFNPKCNLLMVPGMGLVLRECHFDGYYKNRGKGIEPLVPEPFLPEIEAFAKPFIYEHIADIELSERSTARWVVSLPLINYDGIIQGSIDRKKQEDEERVKNALAKQLRYAEFLKKKAEETAASAASSSSSDVPTTNPESVKEAESTTNQTVTAPESAVTQVSDPTPASVTESRGD